MVKKTDTENILKELRAANALKERIQARRENEAEKKQQEKVEKDKKELNKQTIAFQTQEAMKKFNIDRAKRIAKEQLREQLQGSAITELRRSIALQQQSQQRQGVLKQLGNRAEMIEHQLCSINEVPFLHSLERNRGEACSPPSPTRLKNFERSVTNRMPQ